MKSDREIWEDGIVTNAAYFTVIRFLGRSNYDRREFKTLKEAIEVASTDKRLMVYAVSANDHSTMIGPKEYERYLKEE